LRYLIKKFPFDELIYEVERSVHTECCRERKFDIKLYKIIYFEEETNYKYAYLFEKKIDNTKKSRPLYRLSSRETLSSFK